jgi:transglutaminase-like putative cysteine protease
MSDPRSLLERESRRFTQPDGAFERLVWRRNRKRRSQRITAGIVGIAVFVAAVWIVTRGGPLDRTQTPGVPGGAATGPTFLEPRTDEQAVRDLFEVQAEQAQYWRLFTLDRFDGKTWKSSDPEGSQGGQTLPTPATLPQAPGYTYPADAESLDQTFRILSDFDSAHALPMALTAEKIVGPIGDISWDPYRAQAFIDGGLEEGLEYTVRSRIVVPTPEELDQVDHVAPRTYGRWTGLPTDLDPRIGELAERWTADATSDYRKVLAIQQHFHNGSFVYSTDVKPADDADALLEFLTRTRTGFCQHYASAMAVMVRALGLPARIGVGYKPGTQQEDGSYLVQTKDAHAWVEVFFDGYGWVPFEPTPGRGTHPNAQPGTYLNPVAPTDAS